MALSILDGNQSATTLSTIVTSGQHIPAHTIVSLGTQAITDMRGAVSGSVVSISNFPSTQTIAGTVTANGLTIGGTIANVFPIGVGTLFSGVQAVADVIGYRLPISLGDSQAVVTASLNNSIPEGTNRIGVVTIGGGTVTIANTSVTVNGTFYQATQPVSLASLPSLVAGTAQIGSVTASISGTVPVSGTFYQATQPVSLASLPALVAGTAQIGSVTASLAISSSAITSGSFTSLTSATLVPANTARKMATVYNLGAGQLFINAGASATTLGGGFMVALSSGDFYECGYTTTTLSAIFATAGTASWISH